MSDKELAENYDLAQAAELGGNKWGVTARYYLDELVRRKNDKLTVSMLKLAKYTLLATIITLIVAIIALFKS